jgi:hypothetical protein
MRRGVIILSSSIYMFINWSLASLEWTLVLYLYMILSLSLPKPRFFYLILAVSSYFRVFLEASICFTNSHFEIIDLKLMIWNPCLLMITNTYQSYFEINNYWWFIINNLELDWPLSSLVWTVVFFRDYLKRLDYMVWYYWID